MRGVHGRLPFLDAWEKSPGVKAEYQTLDAFLRNMGEWPHCHVFTSIRQPELENEDLRDQAYCCS